MMNKKIATRVLKDFTVPPAPPKTAVIVGGTGGIGAAIARRCVIIGVQRVFVMSRNAKTGQEAAKEIETLGKEGSTVQVRFVQGDVSDSKGMRKAAEDLRIAVGQGKIDYLFLTQNGPPVTTLECNSDGVEINFAIQAVSRFAITYLLIKSQTLNPGAKVIYVANPGFNNPTLDVEDLSLKNVKARTRAGMTMSQSSRDSCVLDSSILEFQTRYPEYEFYHLHPGLVVSEHFRTAAWNFPFPISLLFVILSFTPLSQTPDDYANVPIYIAFFPDADKSVKNVKFLDHQLAGHGPAEWAKDDKNRLACWNKLMSIIGEV